MMPAIATETARERAPREGPSCRFCGARLRHTFVDLGCSPLAQRFLAADRLGEMEPFYPLRLYVCDGCFLVQLEEFVAPRDIFGDYAYFSSYSETWLDHARRYVEEAIARHRLGPTSQVVEIASNDGYLLQYFVARGIPVLGIEPAANVAAAAVEKGIPTRVAFFDAETARRLVAEGRQADLVVANNVLAHVPALNDFVEGLRIVLGRTGVVTLEFPHVMRLIAENQFDTIYHEHFSYFSLLTVEKLFTAHDLTVFDVEELPTHGGSLRIHVRHAGDASKPVGPRVAGLLARERAFGLTRLSRYAAFAEQVKETKRALLEFLIAARRRGKSVVGYGAPAKANTLLNYCGIRTDLVDYTVDRSPHKQGLFTPGVRLPIFHPDRVRETRPDYLLVLPWNLEAEVTAQMAFIREWGGRFVVPIPTARVRP